MQAKLRIGIAIAIASTMATSSFAQGDRQDTKNEWRNIAIASGILTTVGLLKKDKTLTFVGAAGALYSLYRYEEDRKSQNRERYMRAAYFSRPYFVRDGVRYDRRLVTRDGQKYYQFVRHDNGLHKGWTKGRGNPHGGGWDDSDIRNRNIKVVKPKPPGNSSHNSKGKSKGKGKGKGG